MYIEFSVRAQSVGRSNFFISQRNIPVFENEITKGYLSTTLSIKDFFVKHFVVFIQREREREKEITIFK